MTIDAGIAPSTHPRTEPRALRYYQTDAADAVERDWATDTTRTAVVLPTGTGKSTVIAKLAVDAYHRNQRTVILAHRGELLDQIALAIFAVDPSMPAGHVGIVRGEIDDHGAPIVLATLQTLAHDRRRLALGHRDVILWDEVHHAGAETWHETFELLGGYTHAKMCGFTATMHRGEKASKIGLGDVIQKISYEKDLRWAIDEGFLVQPHGLTVRVDNLNALDDIRNVAGDFHQGQLADIMEAATEYVVDAIEMHAKDRQSIVFAASVAASTAIAEALADRGFAAEAVTGHLTYDDRDPVYRRFRTGETKIMVTVMVLTEGADFPMCDAVVIARPTRSRNLYSQMVGRALRLWPEKTDALVLDLAGSARNMRLVNLSQLDKAAPMREVNPEGDELVPEITEDIGAGSPEARPVRQGPVDMVTVDLLGGASDTLWLETPAGVPFISLSDGWVVFLWPEEGVSGANQWAVGNINTKTKKGGWAATQFDGSPRHMFIDDAVREAESWILRETDYPLPVKDASWRRNQAPSEAQMRFARTLHIVGAEDFTKARLSDEISVKLASRVLDGSIVTEAQA